MRLPPYDDPQVIPLYLQDLQGLNRLSHERREAGYERKERLHNFIILGRWSTDSCGNMSRLVRGYEGIIPAEVWEDFPPVVTDDEMRRMLRKGESWCSTMGWPFPKPYSKCSECGKSWTLQDCHDFEIQQGHDEEPLDQHLGELYRDIRVPRLEGVRPYFPTYDMVINLSYVRPEGEREHSMRDGRPWHYVDKEYRVQAGDIMSMQTIDFVHKECLKVKRAKDERQYFKDVFAKAGFPDVNLIAIPNEYFGNDPTMPPWYMAQVGEAPVVKIGWRKRVINIDWGASKRDLQHLFTGEDVTKGSDHIHAWTTEKAAEYLAKIVPAIQ